MPFGGDDEKGRQNFGQEVSAGKILATPMFTLQDGVDNMPIENYLKMTSLIILCH